MNTNAQNRSAFGAVAEAIKALCVTLISLFGLFNKSIAMADSAVTVAQQKQAVDLGIDLETYSQQAMQQAQVSLMQSSQAVADYVGDDPKRMELHAKAKARIEEAVKRQLATLNAA